MTKRPNGDYQPSRGDVLRPAEFVGGAAIAAVFVGIITFAGTRDWTITLIATGGVFIVVLMVLALLLMTVKPDASERAELDEGDAAGGDEQPPPAH